MRDLSDEEMAAAKVAATAADKAWSELVLLRAKEGFADSPLEMDARLEAARQKAVELLDAFCGDYPAVKGRDLALFRLGEALALSSDLEEAHDAYSELLKKYPGSPFFSESLRREFKIACRMLAGEQRSILGVGIFGKSSLPAEILEGALELGPFAEWAPEALYLLANLKIGDDEHDTAIVHFDTLVRRFPDSGLRVKAEYQAARANFLKFRGLDYDITPLEEALERFRSFINLHEEDPSPDVRLLVGLDRGANRKGTEPRFTGARLFRNNIESLLAEKDWRVGRWYESEGLEAAAVSSYRHLIQEYPETEWAGKASRRIPDLQND